MTRNETFVFGLIVAVVVSFVLFQASAVAEGAQLGNDINLPGLNFSMNSYEQTDGRLTLSSNLSTVDKIEDVYVNISKDKSNPNEGWISMSFRGVVGTPAVKQNWSSNSMQINYRGLKADTNAGIGAYQEIVGWTEPSKGDDGVPIFGNWMSTASGSVTLSNISLLYSNGGYTEYTYTNYEKGGFESGSVGTEVTEFSAFAQFKVQFDNSMAATVFSGMGPTSMSVVPEPATMCLLAVGAIGMISRRRQR